MKIAIMTDSNSGFSEKAAKELGIFLLPMPIIIEETTCYEGIDLTEEQFYNHLTQGENITTSQPSPADLMDMWDDILSQGYDQIIHIPMSSGLSNSCATALTLAQEYDGKVFVVDNHRISVTLKASVLEAKKMAEQNYSAAQIKEHLEKHAYDSSIYIAVDTLEYLKKGGRITPAAATFGKVLNIKPVLTIQGGKLDAFAKVRGMKKAKNILINALKNDLETRFQNIDSANIIIGAAGAGLTSEQENELKELISEHFPMYDFYYDALSLSISTHTGPGAMGVGIAIRSF